MCRSTYEQSVKASVGDIRCCLFRKMQQRHILVWTAFVGFALAYSVRINLSVAIVSMVNQTYVREHDEKMSFNDSCPNLEPGNSSGRLKEGEFQWTHKRQGIIAGSFFYGYGLSQILGGIMADRFGGKHILGFGIFLSSVMCLLVPPLARIHYALFLMVRILGGFFQGVMYPAISTLLSEWSPIDERGFLFMIPTFGVYIGVVITFPITGWLCDHGFAGGWPSAFYVFGIAGCLWLIPWMYLTSSSPTTHTRISREERLYILNSINRTPDLELSVPWRRILTSVPVLAVVFSSFMGGFGFMSLLAFVPTYFNEILKFDIVSNGLLSVVPYIGSAVGTFIAGMLSETISTKLDSVTASRKILNSLATIGAGVFLIGIALIGCNRSGAIALLTTSTFLSSFNTVGYIISPLDIAPRYAGSIMGLANTFATVGMILGPYVTGALTNSSQTLQTWMVAFYVMGSITMFGGLIFLLFGVAKIQPWAVEQHEYHVIKESESEHIS